MDLQQIFLDVCFPSLCLKNSSKRKKGMCRIIIMERNTNNTFHQHQREVRGKSMKMIIINFDIIINKWVWLFSCVFIIIDTVLAFEIAMGISKLVCGVCELFCCRQLSSSVKPMLRLKEIFYENRNILLNVHFLSFTLTLSIPFLSWYHLFSNCSSHSLLQTHRPHSNASLMGRFCICTFCTRRIIRVSQFVREQKKFGSFSMIFDF